MGNEVNYSGPLFKENIPKFFTDLTDRIEEELAQATYDKVRVNLDKVLKKPTGYYKSRIQVSRVADSNVVNDSGVIYGPWLEGVGSRNKTSRFKGYSTFRRTVQEMDADAVRIAEVVVDREIGRLQ